MTARHPPWAALNAVALVLALVANTLAVTLPLNGQDTGALSDLYPNLFVPAGLTFSIWGVIYSWLIAFVVYGLASSRARAPEGPVATLGPWFVVNGLANAAWIFAWHWMLVPLSLAIMLVLLASLIVMYLRLGIGVRPTGAAERWLVRVPISIYMGWITVATIANVTALAVDLGAPSFGPVPAILTVVVLATAVAITAAMLWTRRDVAFALVVVWAFLGIYLARSASSEDGAALIATTALVGLVALGLGVLAAAVAQLTGRAAAS
jgi:hypothetical protein